MVTKPHPTSIHPIGIFDSGIGGLAVTKAIKSLLPHETIYYVGDTQNLPYGTKKKTAIQECAKYIVDFLLSKGCKLILIACNSATAAAGKLLQQHVGNAVPVLNVIYPVIQHIKSHYIGEKIGLIGTNYTVDTGIYDHKLKSTSIILKTMATPQLVPMIEQGFFKNKIDTKVLHYYLKAPCLHDIQGLILGCTHYLLLKEQISLFYKGRLKVIDTATLTAITLKKFLLEHHLSNTSTTRMQDLFMASQLTHSFQEATRSLIGTTTIQVKLPPSPIIHALA